MIDIKRLRDGTSFDVEFMQLGSEPETLIPHRHEYYEMFWVMEGEGRQSIDFVEYTMSPGRLFCITPGQVHDVHSVPDRFIAISFNAEFIDSQQQSQLPVNKLFLQNRSQHPFLEVDKHGQRELSYILEIVSRELQSKVPNKDLMSTLLVGFLQYLTRYLDEPAADYSLTDRRMIALLQLIDEHYLIRKDTGFYSDKLAMTSKRLNELSREQFSRTVTQLLHDKIMVSAKRELAFSQKTIKTISYELGYKDTSYFCRFFKRQSGLSPQSFRESWAA